MRELLLFSQSQSLINHWINSVEDRYYAVMDSQKLYDLLDPAKEQIILYDLQSFEEILPNVMQKASAVGANLLALTGSPSFESGSALLPLKIDGYGNSYMSAENLQLALEVISEGKVWLYPDFVQALIVQASQHKESVFAPTVNLTLLTPKELEVAKLVAKGRSNKEVATHLDITERTVKAHLTHIYEKLNISDRLSLALMMKE